MSTLESAYYFSIPARYAVGRWYDTPPATLLVYNTVDLGLNILEDRIMHYLSKREREIPQNLILPVFLASKIVFCLTAVYVTSKLTEPMPLKAAEITTVASLVTAVFAALIIFAASQGQKI